MLLFLVSVYKVPFLILVSVYLGCPFGGTRNINPTSYQDGFSLPKLEMSIQVADTSLSRLNQATTFGSLAECRSGRHLLTHDRVS